MVGRQNPARTEEGLTLKDKQIERGWEGLKRQKHNSLTKHKKTACSINTAQREKRAR